jgi:dTMP kinase
MFIALEGIDGSGKGTHCRLLNRWIREKGFDTYLTKEPTDGPIGRLLRKFLKTGGLDSKTEALLFAADRSEHLKDIISKLREGKVVITERYFFSSIAYQGAADVSIDWIMEINKFAPMPDLVLYLDITPEEAIRRISTKNSLRSSVREREYFEKKEFLGKVRAIYLELAKKYEIFSVIDASGSIEEVQGSIRRRVGRLLGAWEDKKKKSSQRELKEFG